MVAEIVIKEASPALSPGRQTTTYPVTTSDSAAPTLDREEWAEFLRKVGLSANDITDIFDREYYLGEYSSTPCLK